MEDVLSCPSGEVLGQLGVEIVDGPRFEELERHVESCDACQAALERMARRSSGPGALADPAGARLDPPEVPGFAIEGELGRGSMGVVYLARQARLGRRVALKLIPGDPVDGARARECWLREARAAARVRDPRVVQIHDVGEAGGLLYLVLEYVPGGSLKQRVKGPLSPESAAALAERIAAGVAAVHRAGLLHLDLKPSNILLDSPPGAPWELCTPRVADFGIAREAEDPRMTRTTLRGPWGTPAYMAPEQVEPDRLAVGPASDVYAVGAILYELLIGRPPFQAASLAATLDLVRHRDPVAPRRLDPSIPRDLEIICTTCLQKDPARRYRSAEALADDLARWRSGRPIAARPVAPHRRAWLWARRRPITAGLSVALASTLILALAGLTTLWRHAEHQRAQAEAMRDVARENNEAASQSLREICDLTYQTLIESLPGWSYPKYLDPPLERARARQLELLRRNPPQLGVLEPLATVDLLLGTIYRARPRREAEAPALFRESIELWEQCIALGADLEQARMEQLQALVSLGTTGHSPPTEAELAWRDATVVQVYRRLSGHPRAVAQLFTLSYRDRQVADYLADAGQAGRARRLLEQRRELFESLLAGGGDCLDIRLARALTLVALGDEGTTSLPEFSGPRGEAVPDEPAARGVAHDFVELMPAPRRAMLVEAIAELAGRRFGLRTLGPASARGASIPDGPARAARLIRLVDEQVARLGLDAAASTDVVWRLREVATSSASHLRAIGNHDEARRINRRFSDLADELVRTRPQQVVSHLLLCEATLQQAKNAVRTGDHAAARRLAKTSLEAALRAQSVAPDSEDARRFVNDRRKRLAAYEAEEAARGKPPAGPTAATR